MLGWLSMPSTSSAAARKLPEIQSRHDMVVNVLLNNILIERGLISHEQKWEDRKTVRTARDDFTVGTGH